MSARFCGTGSCVPDYVMDNDGVAELVETSDSWIRERTGIARRHIAVKETTVSMANEAAKRALDNAGVLPEELDLILMFLRMSLFHVAHAKCKRPLVQTKQSVLI